ncbi:MAG: histidinol phosphate phosphatase domain-containing protein [Candidatus Omnitrophota bacterium]
MIDLHTHTILSDGELLPSELVRRAVVNGYKAIALADHVDASNIDFVIPRIAHVAKQLNSAWDIVVIPAAELTHIPIEHIKGLVKKARHLGARLILVHGQTEAEPVLPGTNKEALLANIDILAHPGMITEEEVKLAIKNNIYLEITTRNLHKETNGHLIKMTRNTEAKLVLDTDTHSPENLITKEKACKFLSDLGLTREEQEKVFLNSQELVSCLGIKKEKLL